jgi:hypothetical protein
VVTNPLEVLRSSCVIVQVVVMINSL